MAATVAVLGTNGGTSFTAYGLHDALTKIGMNTGNIIYQFALWKLIGNPKFECEPTTSAAQICENSQHILIPAANQVNPAWDMGWLANLLEDCDLPVTCIGLGAQASLGESPRLELKPGTIRYLKVLSERTTTIGVRGSFTQEVLAHFGVTNTVVTGCPSQTINPSLVGANIQAQLEGLKHSHAPSVVYVLGTLEEHARQAERNLALLMSRHRHQLVLQTDPSLLRTIFDRGVAEEDESYVNWVGSVMRPDLNYEEFKAYFLESAVFYSDARTWIDSMRRYDLVIGMRIHGAVTAIQAGKLGICVAFDSRTKELAETMGYPYLPIERVEGGQSLQQMVDHVVFDDGSFDRARASNTAAIRGILSESGLTVAAPLPS